MHKSAGERAPPEVRGAPWAFSALHERGAAVKCHATIADTVLAVEDGNADGLAWYFTTRIGEVARKRHVAPAAVAERFSRVAQALAPEGAPPGHVAVARMTDGSYKLLDGAALVDLASRWPPSVSEPNVRGALPLSPLPPATTTLTPPDCRSAPCNASCRRPGPSARCT